MYTFGSLSLPSIVVAADVAVAVVALLSCLCSFAPVAVAVVACSASRELLSLLFLAPSFSLKRFKMATAKAGKRLARLASGVSTASPSASPPFAPFPAPVPVPAAVAVVVAVAVDVEVEVAFMSALSVSLLFLVSIVVKGWHFVLCSCCCCCWCGCYCWCYSLLLLLCEFFGLLIKCVKIIVVVQPGQ